MLIYFPGILPPENPDETLQRLFGRYFKRADNSRDEALRSDQILGVGTGSVAPRVVEGPGRYFSIRGRDATLDCFIENLADIYRSFRFFDTCSRQDYYNTSSVLDYAKR